MGLEEGFRRDPARSGEGRNERAISGITRRRRRVRSAPTSARSVGIERLPFLSDPRQRFAIYGGSARCYEWARVRLLDASYKIILVALTPTRNIED